MNFEIYQDLRGEWRWRIVADNGRVIADSSEGYSTRSHLDRAVDSFINHMQSGQYTVTEA